MRADPGARPLQFRSDTGIDHKEPPPWLEVAVRDLAGSLILS